MTGLLKDIENKHLNQHTRKQTLIIINIGSLHFRSFDITPTNTCSDTKTPCQSSWNFFEHLVGIVKQHLHRVLLFASLLRRAEELRYESRMEPGVSAARAASVEEDGWSRCHGPPSRLELHMPSMKLLLGPLLQAWGWSHGGRAASAATHKEYGRAQRGESTAPFRRHNSTRECSRRRRRPDQDGGASPATRRSSTPKP